MKTGNIILEVTHGLDVELGSLKWITVKNIVEKHIENARNELLRIAATDKRCIEERRKVHRGENYVAFERI
jgi:hypothetical protein